MLHELQFLSYNKRDTVQAWVYVPADRPTGIVQLIHGFGEHSRRYLHMIVAFMDAGYIVAADDHVGHGATAILNNTWGDWGDGGPHTMMEDEHTLHDLVCDMYPDLPYFIFGHSMGSMIARDYIAKYGDELAGVTLCGTVAPFPGQKELIKDLEALVAKEGRQSVDASLGGKVMGWMFDRIAEEVKLGNEWICHDPFVQRDHAADPFDAFTKPTTNGAWLDFIQMNDFITGKEWAEKVPADLPILNIAGDQDPCGQYGAGVYQVSNDLIDTGHTDVQTKLYSGYRHEIHNYGDIKEDVEETIIDFMDWHLE
ncbi:MAG: alpha/beta fold hydrolase [Solobacterium sp.]|nr:alpha/beta fold hydrolase [Solobacterium sp.]